MSIDVEKIIAELSHSRTWQEVRSMNVRIDKNTLGRTGGFTQHFVPEQFSVGDYQ